VSEGIASYGVLFWYAFKKLGEESSALGGRPPWHLLGLVNQLTFFMVCVNNSTDNTLQTNSFAVLRPCNLLVLIPKHKNTLNKSVSSSLPTLINGRVDIHWDKP